MVPLSGNRQTGQVTRHINYHFIPAGEVAMGQKLRVAKRKQVVRRTPRRLSELMAEFKDLERQVRVAEAARPQRSQASMTR